MQGFKEAVTANAEWCMMCTVNAYCKQCVWALLQGFKEAVTANAEWFEGTGLVLTASGAWVSDDQPCLTYGMRGLICLEVEVLGPKKDLHSGTHGGVFNEPTNDLVTVLSNLVDSNNMILIPGFYDDVKPMDDEEQKLYNRLQLDLDDYKVGEESFDLTVT